MYSNFQGVNNWANVVADVRDALVGVGFPERLGNAGVMERQDVDSDSLHLTGTLQTIDLIQF